MAQTNGTSVCDILSKGASAITKSLLSNPTKEMAENASDRLSGSISVNSSLVSQKTVATKRAFNPSTDSQDDFRSQSYKSVTSASNVGKLVLLGRSEWTPNDAEGTRLLQIKLPEVFYNSQHKPAFGQTRYFKYLRTSFTFEIQVNAVTGSSGGLIAYYLPDGTDEYKTEFKTMPLVPSDILNVGAQTSGRLIVPYTSYQNYTLTDSTNLGIVNVAVWAKLFVPTGTPNTLTISIFGSMDDYDLQNPRPQGPIRQKIDIAEGPGAMNLATGIYTRKAQTVALCGESAANDHKTAGAKAAIRDLKVLLKIPLPANQATLDESFEWTNLQKPGDPVYKASFSMQNLNHLFAYMTNCYGYWRGSITFTVTMFASTLHSGRLRIGIFPNDDTDVTEEQIDNAIYSVFDLGLQTSVDLTMPYSYNTWMRDTSDSEWVCRLSIFVSSRLSSSSAATDTVRGIVYVRAGEDFELYAPLTRGVVYQGWADEPWPEGDPLEDWGISSEDGPAETDNLGATTLEGNSEQMAVAAGVNTLENGDLKNSPETTTPQSLNGEIVRVRVIKATHTNIQKLLARAQYIGVYRPTVGGSDHMVIPLPAQGYMSVLKLFAYWTGDLNIHIHNHGDSLMEVAHSYLGNLSVSRATVSSLGSVIVPPNSSMSITVPFYSATPVRSVRDWGTLGHLYLFSEGNSEMTLWISFQTVSLYFPSGVPKRTTVGQWIDEHGSGLIETPEFEMIAAAGEDVDLDGPVPLMVRKPETLADKLSKLKIAKPQGWIRDLTEEGIESNPGPRATLVYKSRGLYRHYGVEYEGMVFELSSDNILDAAITGKVPIVCSEYGSGWTIEETVSISELQARALAESVGKEHVFSADSNCESWAKGAIGIDSISQARALATIGVILIVVSGAKAYGQSPMEFFSGIGSRASEMANGIKASVVDSFRALLTDNLLEGIKCDIAKMVAKLMVKFICYAICFCSSPGLLTGAAVATLVAMDLASLDGISSGVKDLLTCLLDGNLDGMCEATIDLVYKNSDDRSSFIRASLLEARELAKPQGLVGDFNAFSLGAKNADWWFNIIARFVAWVRKYIAPTEADKARQYLDTHSENMMADLSRADMIILDSMDKSKLKSLGFQDKVRTMITILQAWKKVCISASFTQVLPTLSTMVSKLVGLTFGVPRPDTVVRPEPVGIWISGPAGCGKSSIVMSIMSQVKTNLVSAGYCETEVGTIFPHPTGSAYFDGYCGQFFHVMDDFAQARDEEDIKLVCQFMSSVPYCVPMADLAEKGTYYTSRAVIATTNRSDFTNVVLTDKPAFERRFAFKFWVRTSKQYQDPNGRLNYAVATKDGATMDGSAWEVCRVSNHGRYGPMDMKTIAQEISDKIIQNGVLSDHTALAMAGFTTGAPVKPQGPVDSSIMEAFNLEDDLTDEEVSIKLGKLAMAIDVLDSRTTAVDNPFTSIGCTEKDEGVKITQKVRDWFNKLTEKWQNWYSKNSGYIKAFAVVATVASTALGIYTALRVLKTEAVVGLLEPRGSNQEQRAYAGPISATKITGKKVVVKPQGYGPSEISHMFKHCAVLTGDRGGKIYCAVTGPDTVQVYAHALEVGDIHTITWQRISHRFKPEDVTVSPVVYEDGIVEMRADLAIIRISGLPFRFPSISKVLSPVVNGNHGVIIYDMVTHVHSQSVQNIRDHENYLVDYRDGMRLNPKGLIYETPNQDGMCGGVVLQKQGSAWKVVGMHHAGDSVMYGMGVVLLDYKPQGLVTETKKADRPVYTPTKTKFRKSPLYGITEPVMGPAPLHPKDPRIEVEIDNLVKNASKKYSVDVFQPDTHNFSMAMAHTQKALFGSVGRKTTWTIVEALSGGGLNPIDLTTSPGTKYVRRGKTKKDLVYCKDGVYYPTPEFEHDVMSTLQAIREGKSDVTFTATLKDELIKSKKISDGNTRVIEACEFDYTVAFRMVCGPIFNAIYETNAVCTGVAVGIDPHKQFHQLMSAMHSNWYGMDYTRYDGSLSQDLMRKGVEVLASCHDDPELVMAICEPTVVSTHLVSDEIWTVTGGMPSGSPSTSVLNSICNLLVVKTAVLAAGLPTLDDLTIVTYGDDVLFSTKDKIECSLIPEYVRDSFGMTVTSVDKTSISLELVPSEATFLKRKFVMFPGTGFVTGSLDIDSMLQKIQWCKGLEQFKSQLDSFTLELVLHGERVYNDVRDKCLTKLDEYRIFFPPYSQRYTEVWTMFFL